MPQSSLQGAVREALKPRSSHQQASVPTLRHRWATHLLEAGGNLRLLQASRGHSAPTTTRLDTHLTVNAEDLGSPAINRIMRARCWARALTSAASMAPTTARNVATGGSPLLCAPGPTLSRAALRRLAANSMTVTPAETTMTATTPVRTGLVPRASMAQPTHGWKTRSVCCGQARTSW